jgi:hypothetical protein
LLKSSGLRKGEVAAYHKSLVASTPSSSRKVANFAISGESGLVYAHRHRNAKLQIPEKRPPGYSSAGARMNSVPFTSRPPSMPNSAPDFWTIAAISVVVTALASLIHEGIGHGGACLLTGSHPLALSTVHFECAREGRIVDAGGTIANIIAGLLFFLVSRTVFRATRLRFFLWLSMTINLLQAAGYFLFSGVGNIGDWAAFVEGLHPARMWRAGLIVAGLVSYALVAWFAVLEMRPFLGQNREERLRRARKFNFVAYFTGGILATVAGFFNPVGMILVAISAAAASFGGTSGLLWMGLLFRGRLIPPNNFEMPPFTRSRGWIVAAVLVAIVFVAVLSPGLKFHPR